MYDLIYSIHYWNSRALIASALIVLAAALLQIFRKKDAEPWIRTLAYSVTVTVVIQVILGFLMYFQGGRPLEPDVHMVYGVGASVALPFFVYVELTAEKRPAVGSYVLAGIILFGLVLRGIMTGN